MNIKIFKDTKWVTPTRDDAIRVLTHNYCFPLDQSKIFHEGNWVSLSSVLPEK